VDLRGFKQLKIARLGMRAMAFARCAALWLTVLSLSLATSGSGWCATPAEPTAAQAGQNVETSAERTQLEIQKLRVEIEKLRQEVGFGWLAPIASVIASFISVVSVAAVLGAMWFQRSTALTIQDRSEKSAFDLKVADILMSSNANWVAKQRLQVLRSLYKDRISEEFEKSFDPERFPGTLNRELKLDLFEAIAEKCRTQADVIDVFSKLFPKGEDWWLKDFRDRMAETRPNEAIPSRETRA
jgi:hypothetical protein